MVGGTYASEFEKRRQLAIQSPAEERPNFVGPPRPPELRPDFVGPRRPSSRSRTTTKTSDEKTPVITPESSPDFVGPPRPPELRPDFVGPIKPSEDAPRRTSQGFISAIQPPTTLTGRLSSLRERLIIGSQESPSQLKRTASGLSLGVVTPLTSVVSFGSSVISGIRPPSPTPQNLQQDLFVGRATARFFESPVKSSEKLLVGELKEFERDPVGGLALLGLGKFSGQKLTKTKVKGSGKVSISGISQKTQKAFVAGEGEILTESLFKVKRTPFQFKEISDFAPSGSNIISSGTRTLKIGDDLFTSSVRSISAKQKGLSIVRRGDDFALELTTQKKIGDDFLFQTRTIKETPKNLLETFRETGIEKRKGKIGTFDISIGANLGAKVDDIVKIKPTKLKGKLNVLDDVFPSASKGPTTRAPSLQSQLLTNVKTASVQQAEEIVKSTVKTSDAFIPIVTGQRSRRPRKKAISKLEPKVKESALNFPTADKTPLKQKSQKDFMNRVLISDDVVMSPFQKSKQKPSISTRPTTSPSQITSQMLNFGITQPFAQQQKQILSPRSSKPGSGISGFGFAPTVFTKKPVFKLKKSKPKKTNGKKKDKRRGFETRFLGSISEFTLTGKTKRGKRKVFSKI